MTDRRLIKRRVKVGFAVRMISWAMVLIAIFTVIMTFLSTFYIWVTDLFMTAKTLIAVLLATFSIWSLRNFLDARVYPVYKIHGIHFLILALIAAYLLTTPVF
ncbi:hypothetical protein [Proteiniclasticum sp. QWL-01]|uniref:hypothetical protein n=1 Tax=Proteiniclasticum sp. QWL-01 TaxID=3036945 RepID=UPI00240EEB06|nr:hypothetical protein [Proteiniclasticum sp. QWL-01]WFF72118.1 hypothetical protein P6M73_12600 [Proteiniclasticum sp. QWL-01]